MMKLNGALLAASLVAATSAFAATPNGIAPIASNVSSPPVKYSYTWDGTQVATGGYGTKITSWSATSDLSSGRDILSVSVGNGTEYIRDDGFWLVLTAGPNAVGIGGDFAIIYGDLINNRITAYKYNGQNDPQSYTDTTGYLQTFNNAISINGSAFSFAIDVTGINAVNYGPGLNIGIRENAGVWYHNVDGLNISYDRTGRITNFGGRSIGYFDSPNNLRTVATCANGTRPNPNTGQCTGQTGGGTGGTPVPEPATLALFGLSLAGLGLATRRRRA